MNNIIIYRYVVIEHNENGEYSLEYYDKNFVFNTVEQAKSFVDNNIYHCLHF